MSTSRRAVEIFHFSLLFSDVRFIPQVKTKTYSLESNLALLRLYQIVPQTGKATYCAKALCLAIMHLPAPDFKSCVHVLGERMQVNQLAICAVTRHAPVELVDPCAGR